MPQVKFKNNKNMLTVPKYSTLLYCIRKAGYKFETPCNAMGMCGKCKVVATGEMDIPGNDEKRFIDENKNERLACIAKIIGDVEVGFLKSDNKLKTINSGTTMEVSALSNIKIVELPMIDKKSPMPYGEILKYSINELSIYEKIALFENEEKDHNSKLYGIVYENEIIDISTKRKLVLGVAIDIGTTGISSYLINIENGQVIKKTSSLNPQTEFGGDVLTRITYCMNNEKGEKELQRVIIDEINRNIQELTDFDSDVYNIVIVGNTTMLHLLLGINPSSMAKTPYRPAFLDTFVLNAKDLGIKINTLGKITILPGASSYVGADIVAGIVASGFNNKKCNGIFVDIGTNGEIVAICNGKLMCTSTAAGPALEGMNIDCGCRAQNGAIESLSIDENYNIIYSTIGDGEPIGICGSGLIDIAAELVKSNIVLKSGKFNDELDEKVKHRLVNKRFYITEQVYISQRDIRQIQLAKGAIAAGITLLLQEMGIGIHQVEETIIAGAFGYHVNAESIKLIGLIPKGFNGNIIFAGNTSVEGARLALINKECFEKMKILKSKMTTLELSTSSKFQECFIKELNF